MFTAVTHSLSVCVCIAISQFQMNISVDVYHGWIIVSYKWAKIWANCIFCNTQSCDTVFKISVLIFLICSFAKLIFDSRDLSQDWNRNSVFWIFSRSNEFITNMLTYLLIFQMCMSIWADFFLFKPNKLDEYECIILCCDHVSMKQFLQRPVFVQFE